MTREQWQIAEPLFKAIRDRAYLTARHAAAITLDISVLPAVPDYDTKAEALLADTEKQLAAALTLIREAQTIYDAKPVSADPVFLQAAE